MNQTPSLKNNPNVDKFHALQAMRALIPILIVVFVGIIALLSWQIFVVAAEYQQALQIGDAELIKTAHRDVILLPIVTVGLAIFMTVFIIWLAKKTKEKKFALMTDINEEARIEVNKYVK